MYPCMVYTSTLLLNDYKGLKLYLGPILMYTFFILFVFRGGRVLEECLKISKRAPIRLDRCTLIDYRR